MDTQELFAKQDFMALSQNAKDGDAISALLAASLAFNAKYNIDPALFATKKAIKDHVRTSCIEMVKDAAETNFLPAIIEACDMFMFGRKEPGQFGGTISLADHKLAVEFAEKILEHPDATSDDIAMTHYRLGHLKEMITRPYPATDKRDYSHIIAHFEESMKHTGDGVLFSAMRLAEIYSYKTEQAEKSIPLLEQIKDKMPYAKAHLSNLYRGTHGITADIEKAQQLFKEWEVEVETYKMKVGSATENTINTVALLKIA